MAAWSEDNQRLGQLACKLGLLADAEWQNVRDAGEPADASERASTDAAVGGTLVRVLIEEGLIDLDGADQLRDAQEAGALDELLAAPAATTASAETDSTDSGDGFDDEFESGDYEADETAEQIEIDERRPGSGSSGRGWLAGLADSDDPQSRKKTARVATVTGKINVRPASAIESPGSSDDDHDRASRVAAPPMATGPLTGAARDPFTGSSQIGPYILLEILKHVDDTAMFKARHSQTGELAAVKVLARPADDPRSMRFLADAASAAALHHRLIAEMQEHGSDNGRQFAAVDFVGDARPLESLPRMDVREAADMVRRLALAIHDAHGAGRVHARLRPGCVLIDPVGEPHISGFVFAGGQPGDDPAAPDPPFHPYMHYASPELVRTDRMRVDARSDVFSLGAILYRLLTGRVPVPADTSAEYRRRVTTEDPVTPRQLDESIPRGLELVCQKAMARDPGVRYPTAADLAEDLQRWLEGREVMARPQRVTQRMQAIVASQPRMAVGGMLLVVVVAVVLVAAGVVMAIAAVTSGGDNRSGGKSSGGSDTNGGAGHTNANAATGNNTHAGNGNSPASNTPTTEQVERRERARAALGQLPQDVDDPYFTVEELQQLAGPLARACGLDPSWSEPEYWLGRTYQRIGRTDDALAHLQRAAALSPPQPRADLQVLMVLAFGRDASGGDGDGLPAAARPHLDRLMRLNASTPELRAMQQTAAAIPKLLAGQTGGSPRGPDGPGGPDRPDGSDGGDSLTPLQASLKHAADLLPRDAGATGAAVLTTLGYALGGAFPRGQALVDRRRAGATRPAEALVALEDALRLDPLAAGPHAVVGLHRETFGQAQQACQALQRALALRSDWPAVEYALARALELNGQLQEAIWKLDSLTARIPDNAEYWRHAGFLQILAGDWQQADRLLTQSLEQAHDPHVQFLRALVRTQIPFALSPGEPHPARLDLEQVVRDPTTTWNRDRDMMFRLPAENPDKRSLLRATIEGAHDYFVMPPRIKVEIRQLSKPQSDFHYIWRTVTERPWSPALGELLDVLDANPERRAALRAGLERFGRDEHNPLIGNITLDDWLTPVRLQRMLHDEQLLEQRSTASLSQSELYVRACVRFRVGRNYHGAHDDLTTAIGMVSPGGTGDQLMARLYYARSAVKLNSGDPVLMRDEMKRWEEAVAPDLADMYWAIHLDRLLTAHWRTDADYERLRQ